jgi:hypothetical protein
VHAAWRHADVAIEYEWRGGFQNAEFHMFDAEDFEANRLEDDRRAVAL